MHLSRRSNPEGKGLGSNETSSCPMSKSGRSTPRGKVCSLWSGGVARPLGTLEAPLAAPGFIMGQLLSTGPDTALALFGVPFVPLRRGPLKPRRLLTYIHSKLFDEQRVQGFKPSHLRCLDRHWTHAEGTVMRSLLWSGRVEVDASEG